MVTAYTQLETRTGCSLESGKAASPSHRALACSITNRPGDNYLDTARRDQQEHAARGELSPKQLQAEILRLRKENKRLQMEREILKKAAAFFAKESD